MSAQIISFNCVLKNLAGQIISTTYNKDVLTDTNDDQAMLYGLAKGLKDVSTGDRRIIRLSAKDAYGFYDPKKVVYFPRKQLAKHISVGESVTIIGKSGKARSYKVVAIHSEMVTLDANHPLAGQDLVFEIETLAARNATREEIEAAKNEMCMQLLH